MIRRSITMAEQFSNFHTHTILCDGKDEPEALVQEALRLGCPALGFSGHSYAPYDRAYCMSPEGTEEYKAVIHRLRVKYAGRIRIYLGVEQDFYSPSSTAGYDYVIGSVHYLYKDGVYLPVDASRDGQEQAVRQHYGGDWYALAEDYFAAVSRVYEQTHCQVVGHFDLLTKFNEGDALFSTAHPRYRRAALRALDALAAAPVVFEINTGAMARGYRTEPYPAQWIAAELRHRGIKRILSSDCHDKSNLLYGFADYKSWIE